MANDNWQLKAVLSAVDRMSPVLKQVANTAKTTRKYLGDVASSALHTAGAIGLPVGLIGGALSALSIDGAKRAVMAIAELGDVTVKSAQRIGVSTDEYQRFNYIAGQSGVTAEELGSSMGRLNKSVALAVAGKNKDLASLFARAGISMRGTNGELRSSIDLLPEVADLFARNGNAAIQARMGNAIFGKSWQSLAPLLQGGSDGIQQLTDRYKQLGLGMSNADLKAGEAFGDQLDDLAASSAMVGNVIGAKLLPKLAPLIERVIGWSVANRDLITTKVSGFVLGLVDAMEKIDWQAMIDGVTSTIASIRGFVNWIGGTRNALLLLVIFINAQAILAVGGLAMSFWRLGVASVGLAAQLSGPLATALRFVWFLLAANPIYLVIAGIVALAAAIYANWDNIVSYVGSAWGRIKAVFDVGFFSGMIQLWLEQWQAMANGILGIVKTITPDFLMPKVLKDFNFSFATDRAARLTGGAAPASAPVKVPAYAPVLAQSLASAPAAALPTTSAAAPGVPGVPGVPAPAYSPVKIPAYAPALAQSLASAPAAALPAASVAAAGVPAPTFAESIKRPSLIAQQAGRVEGSVKVDFSNLPQGARVEQSQASGNMPLKLNVGYSSASLGGAF